MDFMCELKKNEVCTIFFRRVTTHQSYLYIFVHLPPTLALPDAHQEEVASQIWSIVFHRVKLCNFLETKHVLTFKEMTRGGRINSKSDK